MPERMLIRNIKTLVQVEDKPRTLVKGADMQQLPCLHDAWLLLENERIRDFGPMETCPPLNGGMRHLDVPGRYVFPSWCDSHTHLVYAGSREGEFQDRIRGLSYQQIAERGGGILNSAALLAVTPEEVLFETAMERIREIVRQGTGAVEIKSGYGLSVESELKMLRVIRQLKEKAPIPVKATFLGAHAIPAQFKGNKQKYIDLIVGEMLPEIAREGLADYCDVFCEGGYFSREETQYILRQAQQYGMTAKVHAEQLSNSGGVEAGVRCDAISVDHLEFVGAREIELLRFSHTMPTILPGAAFFLGLPFPPARKMIDAGLPLAIASDYNPGSSPSGNMHLMVSIACIQYKMMPEEAINAATLNSAYAMGLEKEAGSIARGKLANLFITRPMPSLAFLPYSFGSDLVERVVVRGSVLGN